MTKEVKNNTPLLIFFAFIVGGVLGGYTLNHTLIRKLDVQNVALNKFYSEDLAKINKELGQCVADNVRLILEVPFCKQGEQIYEGRSGLRFDAGSHWMRKHGRENRVYTGYSTEQYVKLTAGKGVSYMKYTPASYLKLT